MSRYTDADALYEKTAEWEAQALHMVEIHIHDEDKTEWKRWSTILTERSAFKFDIADSPTADVVEVVRCKDCSKKESCRTFNVWAVPPSDDWFCADGERRENG